MTTQLTRLERMKSEYTELEYKLDKLNTFLREEEYSTAPGNEELCRCFNQREAMEIYLGILLERLEFAKKKKKKNLVSLTKSKKVEYVLEQWGTCPYCESNSIDIIEGGICMGNQYLQNIHCLNCNSKWREIFTLSNIEEIDSTSNDSTSLKS